jgi:hypothetical protein
MYRNVPAGCLTGRWSCSSRHELVGREIVETRMRPHFVVPPPCFDDHLCFGAGGKPFEAQALVAGTCREACRDTILPGLPGLDQRRADAVRDDPGHPCAAPAALPPATADGLPPASLARSPVFCATSFITSISSSRSAPASSAAHSWSSCFSRRTSLAPAVDRLFADPVPLGHRQHQLAIRLAQDRHYLPFRETRCAHCSLRIASQSLT